MRWEMVGNLSITKRYPKADIPSKVLATLAITICFGSVALASGACSHGPCDPGPHIADLNYINWSHLMAVCPNATFINRELQCVLSVGHCYYETFKHFNERYNNITVVAVADLANGNDPSCWSIITTSVGCSAPGAGLFPQVKATGVKFSGVSTGKEDCTVDCWDPALSADQRDRCGLWYQVASLTYSSTYPIPTCEEYVRNGTGPCPGGQLSQSWSLEVQELGLGVYCSREGRVMGVRVKPWLERRVPSAEGDVCEVAFEGTLAPQLAALDLRVVYAASWFAELSWDHCRVVRKGLNMIGTIPRQWNTMQLTYLDVSGNKGLTGEVPEDWAVIEGLMVRMGGTQLTDNDQCDLDCFSLTGPARDRCSVWYQLNLMSKRNEFWLPPCRAYIMAPRKNCGWELPKEWEGGLMGRRNRDVMARVTSNGLTRFVGWQHAVRYHCNEAGRMTWLEIMPYAFNERGDLVYQQGGTYWLYLQQYDERLLNPYMVPGTCGGKVCTFYYDNPLAPQLGALDHVEAFGGNAGMFSIEWYSLLWAYRCLHLSWVGNNLTGVIPKELGQMASLKAVELYGNGHLSGPLPGEWLAIQQGVYKGFLNTLSNLTPVAFTPLELDKACKRSQTKSGGYFILQDDVSVSIAVNIDRSMYEGNIAGLLFFSLGGSNMIYCGKEPRALVYVVLAWGLFGIALAVTTLLGGLVWRWKRRSRRPVKNRFAQLQQVLKRLRGPLFAIMTLYDLATDLLLAFSMYPSWTTWFVLGAASVPSVICSIALVAHGAVQIRENHSWVATGLMTLVLFLTTVTTFPFLVALVVVQREMGWQFPSSGIWSCWSTVDTEKLASLFSGWTACTEDIFISVFTTVGFLKMAQAPWQVNKANIYFAPWTFWLSVCTAMLHMVVFWYGAVEAILERTVILSVQSSFMALCHNHPTKRKPQGLGSQGTQEQVVQTGPGDDVENNDVLELSTTQG